MNLKRIIISLLQVYFKNNCYLLLLIYQYIMPSSLAKFSSDIYIQIYVYYPPLEGCLLERSANESQREWRVFCLQQRRTRLRCPPHIIHPYTFMHQHLYYYSHYCTHNWSVKPFTWVVIVLVKVHIGDIMKYKVRLFIMTWNSILICLSISVLVSNCRVWRQSSIAG